MERASASTISSVAMAMAVANSNNATEAARDDWSTRFVSRLI